VSDDPREAISAAGRRVQEAQAAMLRARTKTEYAGCRYVFGFLFVVSAGWPLLVAAARVRVVRRRVARAGWRHKDSGLASRLVGVAGEQVRLPLRMARSRASEPDGRRSNR
jgi:hypothetical protein